MSSWTRWRWAVNPRLPSALPPETGLFARLAAFHCTCRLRQSDAPAATQKGKERTPLRAGLLLRTVHMSTCETTRSCSSLSAMQGTAKDDIPPWDDAEVSSGSDDENDSPSKQCVGWQRSAGGCVQAAARGWPVSAQAERLAARRGQASAALMVLQENAGCASSGSIRLTSS